MGLTFNLANKGGYMTSKDLSIFNSLRPLSIGFDDMFDQFESMLGNGNLAYKAIIRRTTFVKQAKISMLSS